MNNKSELDTLRVKLKAETKLKLCIERRLLKLRNVERSYREDLHLTGTEIQNLTQQLEKLKDKIYEANYEISRLVILKSAETSKFDTSISILNEHRKEFQDQFDRDNYNSEQRNRELQQREAAEQETWRKLQKEREERNLQQTRDICVIEDECLAIERECSVLKKRNNAIMLKLRRKLVETEETRRELMKKQG